MPHRRQMSGRRLWRLRAVTAASVMLLSALNTASEPRAGEAEAAALTRPALAHTAPSGSSQVLVATCAGVGSDAGSGKERLALRVVDDHGATRLLGYAQIIQYGYVDIPTGCEDVPRRIDATGHWLVAEDNPARRAGAFEHEPDYRTLRLITLYNLRTHTHRTIYRRTRMTFGDRQPRLVRPSNIAVFTDHGQRHALTIPHVRPVAVPPIPARPRAVASCDLANHRVVFADGRHVNLPVDLECATVLGWLSTDQLAVAVEDPSDPFLETLYVLNPTAGTATPIAPAPGYDPRVTPDIYNVSFTQGAVSGGKAYVWVRILHNAGTARVSGEEDLWAVGPDSPPVRVLHFDGHQPGGDVASVTPWPLTP